MHECLDAGLLESAEHPNDEVGGATLSRLVSLSLSGMKLRSPHPLPPSLPAPHSHLNDEMVALLETMDAIRAQLGVTFPEDEPTAVVG